MGKRIPIERNTGGKQFTKKYYVKLQYALQHIAQPKSEQQQNNKTTSPNAVIFFFCIRTSPSPSFINIAKSTHTHTSKLIFFFENVK